MYDDSGLGLVKLFGEDNFLPLMIEDKRICGSVSLVIRNMNMKNVQQTELFPSLKGQIIQDAWFPQALASLGIEENGGWPDAFGNAISDWNRNKKFSPVTAISLFSGAGGLDIGFHDAGFKIVECNEIEPKFAETLHKNASLGEKLYEVTP